MIRKRLLTGILTLLPLVVTLWILKAIITTLIDMARLPMAWMSQALHLPTLPTWALAILSATTTLALLFLVGLLVSNFIGRQILDWLDEFMLGIPGVKAIYGATKQVISAIQSGQGGSFKEVVLLEWPHPGSQTLGFVAKRDCSWAMEGGEKKIAVYIPTAPNPTSGYVVMVDESKVQVLDISPEQAFTWAVSGGVVSPGKKNGHIEK